MIEILLIILIVIQFLHLFLVWSRKSKLYNRFVYWVDRINIM